MLYYRISKYEKILFFGKKIAQVWAVTLRVYFSLFFALFKIKLLFVTPSFRKQLLFSKFKLLFISLSFENNCFFHKFNRLNTVNVLKVRTLKNN